MPHIFVLVLLLTVVWTAGGSPSFDKVPYRSVALCKKAKAEFIQEMNKSNETNLFNLKDEYDAECFVFTSTIDQPI